jgi:hypothetical protein
MRAWLISAVALPAALLALGCGSPAPQGPSYGSDDGKEIANVVARMSDENTPAELPRTFVAGAVPKDAKQAKRYSTYTYRVNGDPTINGAEATAKVTVRSVANSATTSDHEWTFAKEGDKWKIKSAPLP